MGATTTAQLLLDDTPRTPREDPQKDPPRDPQPRAKALGVTLMKPRRDSVDRLSIPRLTPVPDEVLLLDEGIAVATYPDDGAVQYETLDALLDDHGMSACDLEVIERVSGVGRWSR